MLKDWGADENLQNTGKFISSFSPQQAGWDMGHAAGEFITDPTVRTGANAAINLVGGLDENFLKKATSIFGAATPAILHGMFVAPPAARSEMAEAFVRHGMDHEDIFKNMNMWKAPDGSWREVVPAKYQGDKIKDQMLGPFPDYPEPLGSVIDRPELFSKEPWLANAQVYRDQGLLPAGVRGASGMDPTHGPIIAMNKYANMDQNSSGGTLEHEMQHLIQMAHGWGLGSNNMHNSLIVDSPEYSKFYNQKMRDMTQRMSLDDYKNSPFFDPSKTAIKGWSDVNKMRQQNLDILKKDPTAINVIQEQAGNEWYGRSAGEQEANMASAMQKTGGNPYPGNFDFREKVPSNLLLHDKSRPQIKEMQDWLYRTGQKELLGINNAE